jgi:threonine dehydrogenase-like Zn-dependent dehydrogenase
MRAVCWEGKETIRVENVPEPVLLNPRDAIVKVTTTAICGSDLHIYDGYIPTMHKGDVLGHEFMGEVVAVGKQATRLKVGDRVVVPFTIACGHCYFCKEQLWSLCDNSNPNAWMAEKLYGYSASGGGQDLGRRLRLPSPRDLWEAIEAGAYPEWELRLQVDAMMRGEGDVVNGRKNKLHSAIASVTPADVLAEQHRRMAEPGSAQKANE